MITREKAAEYVLLVEAEGGNVELAARKIQAAGGISPSTLRRYINYAADVYGIRLGAETVKPRLSLRADMSRDGEVAAAQASEDSLSEGGRRRLMARLREAERRLEYAADIRAAILGMVDPPPPAIHFAPVEEVTAGESTAVLLLSDWQIGEVVRLREMDGINEFNMDIAGERAEKLFNKAVALSKLAGGEQPRCVVACMGDMINGEIHEEYLRTNDLLSAPAVRYTYQLLRAGIDRLLEHFPRVHLMWVDGNHDRNTKKISAKGYCNTSYGAIIGWWLEDAFRRDPRLTIQQPASGDAMIEIYGHRCAAIHGDRMGAKGGQGFAGAILPILRGHHKVMLQYARLRMPLDYVFSGHMHTSCRVSTGFGNGALVGYNEYARATLRAMPEPAQQTLLFISKTHGVRRYEEIHLSAIPRIDPSYIASLSGDAA